VRVWHDHPDDVSASVHAGFILLLAVDIQP
jgi:hypothetical protein